MNFNIEKIDGSYYVTDSVMTNPPCVDRYGPFDTYKEATDFMEEQIGLLYEHGAVCGIPEGEDNHYRE